MSHCKIKKYKPQGPVNLYCYFISSNPHTSFITTSMHPTIHKTAYIGPFSSVIGDVTLDENVFVACNVTLRADEGTPFYIGCNSNIQDGVIFHGLENEQLTVNEKKYSIYIGSKVTIAHRALVHGPSIVGNKVFIGFNAIIFNAMVEDGCYIDSSAIVTGGVRLHADTYVPTGKIIDTQEKANALGKVPKSKEEFAKEVVKVNNEFSSAYALKFGDTRCSCGLCCNRDDIIHD